MFKVESESQILKDLAFQMEEFFMTNQMTYSICENCGGLNRFAFSYPEGKSPVCGKCKTPLSMHEGINELKTSTLESLSRKSPHPVVVDFWAPWCGPCRSFAPTFKEAANRLKGQVVFGKVNTEAEPLAGAKFSVKGIPTLIIFHQGHEISRISGALPLENLMTWIRDSTESLSL